ncbi:MAG: hypothetical protein WA781_04810, partial [Pseudolabrys sp.]
DPTQANLTQDVEMIEALAPMPALSIVRLRSNYFGAPVLVVPVPVVSVPVVSVLPPRRSSRRSCRPARRS